jgi:MerR family transcriptional regulator, copper efflux regulator
MSGQFHVVSPDWPGQLTAGMSCRNPSSHFNCNPCQEHGFVISIRALAQQSGLSAPTIRYYEEIGLIPPAERSAAQQRRYGSQDVARLIFLRRCRDFGFTIDEARALLALSLDRDGDCQAVREVAQGHLVRLRQRLADLTALERQVAGFVAICNAACAGNAPADCASLVPMRSLTLPEQARDPEGIVARR